MPLWSHLACEESKVWNVFPAKAGNRTGMRKLQLKVLVLSENELEDKASGSIITFLSVNIFTDPVSYVPLFIGIQWNTEFVSISLLMIQRL